MRRSEVVAVLLVAAGVVAWRKSRFSKAGHRRRMWDGSFWRMADVGPTPREFVVGGPLAMDFIGSARKFGLDVEPVSVGEDTITVRMWRPS